MAQRHIIVLATFLATFCAYVERVGFSIAFTSMAQQDSSIGESVKGTILSAFYWGYGLSQVIPFPMFCCLCWAAFMLCMPACSGGRSTDSTVLLALDPHVGPAADPFPPSFLPDSRRLGCSAVWRAQSSEHLLPHVVCGILFHPFKC